MSHMPCQPLSTAHRVSLKHSGLHACLCISWFTHPSHSGMQACKQFTRHWHHGMPWKRMVRRQGMGAAGGGSTRMAGQGHAAAGRKGNNARGNKCKKLCLGFMK